MEFEIMEDLVERWKLAARRDDILDVMVPSDIRQLIGEIERLRAALKEGKEATDEYVTKVILKSLSEAPCG